MSPGSGKEPGRGSNGRVPADITAAKRSNVVSTVADATGISPERELAAWAATVETSALSGPSRGGSRVRRGVAAAS